MASCSEVSHRPQCFSCRKQRSSAIPRGDSTSIIRRRVRDVGAFIAGSVGPECVPRPASVPQWQMTKARLVFRPAGLCVGCGDRI
jgi:hypothetical protein